MTASLIAVFLDVVTPVFGIVALGYLLGPRLDLSPRTLSRAAFYVFVPAFVFHTINHAQVELGETLRMAGFVVVSHGLFALSGWLVARLLRCSREMTAAFVMVAVFGNVGNFGLALINFRLGPGGLAPATVYFLLINVFAFGTCVGVAAWARGSGHSPLMAILKTPALVAVVPAALLSGYDVELPVAAARILELLAGAMIPTMLLALGLQLAAAETLKLSREELVATSLRLVLAPLLAWATVGLFGIGGLSRAAGILQAGMPVAVLVSIVSIEYQVAPRFVTSVVFFSTICSLPTLTVLLALV